MAWIEVHQTLMKHKKTIKTAGRLSVDRHKIIGHLLELWCWALDNVPSDGYMGDISDSEIAIAAEWDGDHGNFVEALVEVGFIDENPDGRWLHDWYDYAGKLLDKREKEKERSKNRRLSNKQPTERPHNDRRSTEQQPQKVARHRTVPYLKEKDNVLSQESMSEYTPEFETFWSSYPRRKEKSGAFKVWKSRIKDGVTPDTLILAAENYAKECERKGTEESYIKHAKTFLGPSKPYEDYLSESRNDEPTKPKQDDIGTDYREELKALYERAGFK